jgi:cold shock CspA family protein
MKHTGTVVRFFPDRHYGFLLFDDGEMFFHEMDAYGFTVAPKHGDKVSFEIGQYKGRSKATNVVLISKAGE